MGKITARASVTVTLQFETGTRWGSDCAIDQIHKQAAEEVCGMIRNKKLDLARTTIVGDPKVIAISWIDAPEGGAI